MSAPIVRSNHLPLIVPYGELPPSSNDYSWSYIICITKHVPKRFVLGPLLPCTSRFPLATPNLGHLRAPMVKPSDSEAFAHTGWCQEYGRFSRDALLIMVTRAVLSFCLPREFSESQFSFYFHGFINITLAGMPFLTSVMDFIPQVYLYL